jgi:hypothetical protein
LRSVLRLPLSLALSRRRAELLGDLDFNDAWIGVYWVMVQGTAACIVLMSTSKQLSLKDCSVLTFRIYWQKWSCTEFLENKRVVKISIWSGIEDLLCCCSAILADWTLKQTLGGVVSDEARDSIRLSSAMMGLSWQKLENRSEMSKVNSETGALELGSECDDRNNNDNK